MMKYCQNIKLKYYIVVFFISAFVCFPSCNIRVIPIMKKHPDCDPFKISDGYLKLIGEKIFYNETSGKKDKLLEWNNNENFLSIGIGHFIWYPKGQEITFTESFSNFIFFLKTKNISIPEWLLNTKRCPWNSARDFIIDKKRRSKKIQDIEKLLINTVSYQVEFLLERLKLALPKILEAIPNDIEREHIYHQFCRVAKEPMGIYALIDYVNFKGEGVSTNERYSSKGWGLLQVLQNMKHSDKPIDDFADSAKLILRQRVQNAPSSRKLKESIWLNGWMNRIETYRQKNILNPKITN